LEPIVEELKKLCETRVHAWDVVTFNDQTSSICELC
jgi:hypothetical protein